MKMDFTGRGDFRISPAGRRGYQALMKVLHVNRSLPRTVVIQGEEVSTGIYKEPVAGPVAVGKLTLEGDAQVDRRVHGGEWQAVYAYPVEHYAHWEKELGAPPFPPGTFGENLTTAGLLETELCIGDTLRAGDVVLQVTSARIPCFKLGNKLNRPDILKPFLRSGFSGFYFRVLAEGAIAAGTVVEITGRDEARVSVRELLGMHRLGEGTRERIGRALEIEALAPIVRKDLLERLEKM
jgi:MOSC domain-containing protein YiiM